MQVKELIQRLSKENPDEEVIFKVDSTDSYLIKDGHFLHAGPQSFKDTTGSHQIRSVVIINLKKK